MNLYPEIVEILNKRGIISEEDIAEFVSDKPQRTYDPFLLPDMEEGVDLILNAADSGKTICIYGDYDADGVTASSLMMDVISQLTDKVFYYIPSRIEEGYGLNNDALDKIKARGASFIITVDCGSVSYEEVRYGESIGLEFVITDHHTVTDRRAQCVNINPNLPESVYPYKLIAGVGVAFKVAQAINKKRPLAKGTLTRNLDLVAIGTVADVMPLIDENRTFVKYGLQIIDMGMRPGIKDILYKVSHGNKPVTARDVAFRIGPMINSAGRVAEASLAADLLQTKDRNQSVDGAELLYQCNMKRRSIQDSIYDRCIEEIGDKPGDDKIIIMNLEDSHEGINGIVAGKLKERYKLPAIILSPSEGGYLKGTSRSIGRLNLYKLLKECEDLFEKFGGHAMACGFFMKAENYDELCTRLKKSMKEKVSQEPDILDDRTRPEIKMAAESITESFIEQQNIFEPCGTGNPRPVVEVECVVSDYLLMGDSRQHIKLKGVLDNGTSIQIVSFGNSDQILSQIDIGQRMNFVGELEINQWKDRKDIQLMLKYINIKTR